MIKSTDDVAGGTMRPFYRKDLFREEIITISPMEHIVKIESEDMKFETLKMEKGQRITLNSEHYEVGIIILAGTADVEMEGFIAQDVGERKDVFSGRPTAVYIPCESQFEIIAKGYGNLEVALCKSRTDRKNKPFVIRPEEIKQTEKGILNWQRQIHEIFGTEQKEESGHLIIGETYGCPGVWATYPYQEDNSKAIFHFRISPSQNKKVQVMRDMVNPRAYYVHDHTTLLVQESYIPVPEVAESQVYYLWFKRNQ